MLKAQQLSNIHYFPSSLIKHGMPIMMLSVCHWQYNKAIYCSFIEYCTVAFTSLSVE